MNVEQAIISFNTDPYDWIDKGFEIAKEKFSSDMQSKKEAMRNGVESNNAGANFYGYKPSSSLSFDDYFSVYYPNVFTPNNDGENDQFIVN